MRGAWKLRAFVHGIGYMACIWTPNSLCNLPQTPTTITHLAVRIPSPVHCLRRCAPPHRHTAAAEKPEEQTFIELHDPVSLTFALRYLNNFAKVGVGAHRPQGCCCKPGCVRAAGLDQ